MKELLSLFAVSEGGVTGVVDSRIDMLGEDSGAVSNDHGRGEVKSVSNSGHVLKIRLLRRPGKVFVFRVPVLERRFICLRRSARGFLGAT